MAGSKSSACRARECSINALGPSQKACSDSHRRAGNAEPRLRGLARPADEVRSACCYISVGSSSARGDERPGCNGDGDVFSTRVGFGESSAGISHRTATVMAESPVGRGGDCGQGAMREVWCALEFVACVCERR